MTRSILADDSDEVTEPTDLLVRLADFMDQLVRIETKRELHDREQVRLLKEVASLLGRWESHLIRTGVPESKEEK